MLNENHTHAQAVRADILELIISTDNNRNNELIKDPTIVFHSISFIILILLSIPVTIWSIILMFNALKVSCGINGNKLGSAFIIALLVAEVISKILIFNFIRL